MNRRAKNRKRQKLQKVSVRMTTFYRLYADIGRNSPLSCRERVNRQRKGANLDYFVIAYLLASMSATHCKESERGLLQREGVGAKFAPLLLPKRPDLRGGVHWIEEEAFPMGEGSNLGGEKA